MLHVLIRGDLKLRLAKTFPMRPCDPSSPRRSPSACAGKAIAKKKRCVDDKACLKWNEDCKALYRKAHGEM